MQIRFWVGLAMLIVPILFLHFSQRKRFAEERLRSRSPFADKLLRPPGESLRLEITKIEEKVYRESIFAVIAIVIPPLFVMQWIFLSTTFQWIFYFSVPLLCYAFAIHQWRHLWVLRQTLRNYRLGFDGERFVASELNQLMAKGYRIYHDFVYDMKPGGEKSNFNIDHIAIGPNGVFAIETKTSRKRHTPGANGQKPHEIVFDGISLTKPDGYQDHKPIQQALDNARDLSTWLTGSATTHVAVTPVIAIPGWLVNRQGKGTVYAFNAKELPKWLPQLPGVPLTPDQIQQYADRIEDHCRDIEGE